MPSPHPFVHEPPPPKPRELIPDPGGFVRGLGLAAVAAAALWAAWMLFRLIGWLATPVAGVLGAVALLSGWAAAIHLTGGEQFDDHPWV